MTDNTLMKLAPSTVSQAVSDNIVYDNTGQRYNANELIHIRNYLSYDIETYPNIFTCTVYDHQTQETMVFEISERINQRNEFIEWMKYWSANSYRMVGFNNLGFDYPVIHYVFTQTNEYSTAYDIYLVAQRIIDTPWHLRFSNRIPQWNHVVEQVDLYLINHFDNVARSTSLKQLEFVMRARNIEDLPYKPGIPVPTEGFDNLIRYNIHDVIMTYQFFTECKSAIEFRDAMSAKTGGEYNRASDYLNYNDTKIGKQYFIEELDKAGVSCFAQEYDQELGRNRKVPIQTHRTYIDLGEIIFPYIEFKTPQFNEVLAELRNKQITDTKGSLKLSAVLNGFKFDFGLGGIHGSVKGKTFVADDEYVIFDWDVASYYPNIAIANKIFPEHLSEVFCDVYEDVYNQRKLYPKGSPENKAMKLALNGVYGDSNSKWSSMFDSKYTMTVTVNGQLMLCMLAESLMRIPNMTMIQINTDGLTFKLPRKFIGQMNQICHHWQQLTGLVLEDAEYSKMAVRDVNNYVAITTKGDVKYKGAYVPFGAHEGKKAELDWNKNHSALIVQKAAADAIVNNIPVRKTIMEHTDPMDFMLLCKVRKCDRLELHKPLMWGNDVIDPSVKVSDIQGVTRYYVAKQGFNMIKVMPPVTRKGSKIKMMLPSWKGKKATGLNKNYEASNIEHYNHAQSLGYVIKDGGTFTHTPERFNEVEAGFEVIPVNQVKDDNIFENINYEYYIKKAEELVNGVISS